MSLETRIYIWLVQMVQRRKILFPKQENKIIKKKNIQLYYKNKNFKSLDMKDVLDVWKMDAILHAIFVQWSGFMVQFSVSEFFVVFYRQKKIK